MAEFRWTNGAGDEDYESGSNWVGGAAPSGSGEELIFPAGITAGPSVNLDQSDNPVTSILIEEGFTGNIGGSGNPLRISADKVVHRGSGKLWYQDEHDSTSFTKVMLIDGPGDADIDGETIAKIIVNGSGITDIAASLTDRFMLVVGRGNQNVQPTVNIGNVNNGTGTGSADALELFMAGGLVNSQAAWDHVELLGGVMVHTINKLETVSIGGGEMRANARDIAVNEEFNDDLIMLGGFLDLTKDSRSVTVDGDLIMMPGSRIKAHVGQLSVNGETIRAPGSILEEI